MPAERTAFVLGRWWHVGATEGWHARAPGEGGIRPDLVLGTSIGAINGVFVAADPAGAAKKLEAVWSSEVVRTAFRGSHHRSARHAGPVRHASCTANSPLRRLLEQHLTQARFEELAVPVPMCSGQRRAGQCALVP